MRKCNMFMEDMKTGKGIWQQMFTNGLFIGPRKGDHMVAINLVETILRADALRF